MGTIGTVAGEICEIPHKARVSDKVFLYTLRYLLCAPEHFYLSTIPEHLRDRFVIIDETLRKHCFC